MAEDEFIHLISSFKLSGSVARTDIDNLAVLSLLCILVDLLSDLVSHMQMMIVL